MIIDSFPFNDELDLLELRLGELDAVVDHFVFIEVKRTYRGQKKPLYFTENASKFAKYAKKLHCITPELGNAGSWEFEKIQRNVLADVVRSLSTSPDDTISFSDCDEIPNPKVLAEYTPDMGLRNLKQYTFYYNFNCLMNYGRREWSRARIGTVQDFLKWGPVEFRGGPRDLDHTFPSIENGGWHGSYFNITLEHMRRKVHSISHDDMDQAVDTISDKELVRRVLNREDLFHRNGVGIGEWVDTMDPIRHPSYFLKNLERFKMFTAEHFEKMLPNTTQEIVKNESPHSDSECKTPISVEAGHKVNVVSSDPTIPSRLRCILLPR